MAGRHQRRAMVTEGQAMATAPPGGKDQGELVEEVREEEEEQAGRKGETENPGHHEMENMGSQEDRDAEEEGEEEGEKEGQELHQGA